MTIVVNTRILSGRFTGVQRYLSENLSRLPVGDGIRYVATGDFGVRGHMWEQFVLPFLCKGDLLWSPSNSGPIWTSRQVVTVHDVVPLDHPEWLNRKFAAWYKFLLPRLLARCAGIIAISQFTKDRILAHGLAGSDKISVVPNGVDGRFRPLPAEIIETTLRALDLPSRKYILAVGSLEPRKNLPRLLAAWRKVETKLDGTAWLVIAGGKGKGLVFGDGVGLGELPRRVHLTGQVPDKLLPGLYSGATGFAYVSEYEGFGLPPLEAMASGVPVLVSDTSVFPEVVGDAGIMVSPYDVDEIAAGILQLLSGDQRLRELRQLGLERAAMFSWDRTASETLNVLRRFEVRK